MASHRLPGRALSLGRATMLLVLLAATAATAQVVPETGEALPPVAQIPAAKDQAPAAKDQAPAPKEACPPGKDDGKKDGLFKGKEGTWPLEGPRPPPPPLPPVPNYPSSYDMGGFPGPPEKKESPGSLQEFIRENLSVKLRGAGTLRLYGLFRGDFDYATARFATDTENPFFVLPNDSRFRSGQNFVPVKPNDTNYALYPRLTRLGAEFYGTPIDCLGGAATSGRFECDFLTNEFINNAAIAALNPESRPLLRLRLAYVTLTADEFTFLIGQDWDLIAPLNPTINDNTLMWNAGNMGDRRPQAKFLWNHKLDDETVLQVQNGLALASAVGTADVDQNGLRDNEASGLPGYEGRLGIITPSHVDCEKIMAGVWGVLAISRMNGTLPPPLLPVPQQTDPVPAFSQLANYRFLTNGIGADLRLPLAEDLTFQGEAWYGQNLSDFRGGVGQGISPPRRIPIHSKGGWCELIYRWCPWYQSALGFTVDDPRDSDLVGLNQPLFAGYPEGTNKGAGVKLNYTYYLSNRFTVGNGLTFGADYVNWNTEYIGFRAGHASLVKFFMQQAF